MNKYNYVELAKRLGLERVNVSATELYACCPLHHETGPSFSMHIESGLWTCHRGCGPERGRTFPELVKLVFGIEWTTAVEWMNGQSVYAETSKLYENVCSALQEGQETATEQYPYQLYHSALPADVAPLPLLSRGIEWETLRRFDVRWDAVRNASVWPMYNVQGEFAGLTWRNWTQGMPKYQNTPGLLRQEILYGLEHVQFSQLIIVVEGQIDAMYCQQIGYPGVALAGSSISATQVTALSKYNRVGLLFDDDDAGRLATAKATKALINAGFLGTDIFVYRYPLGREEEKLDPNSLSPDELVQVISTGESILRRELAWLV